MSLDYQRHRWCVSDMQADVSRLFAVSWCGIGPKSVHTCLRKAQELFPRERSCWDLNMEGEDTIEENVTLNKNQLRQPIPSKVYVCLFNGD